MGALLVRDGCPAVDCRGVVISSRVVISGVGWIVLSDVDLTLKTK